jgi:hypothetical protein
VPKQEARVIIAKTKENKQSRLETVTLGWEGVEEASLAPGLKR